MKNIIILVLLLANLCLAGILMMRQDSQYATQEMTTNELVALFQRQGVSLSSETIPWQDPLRTITLEQDVALNQRIAKALLGEDASYVERGGIAHYETMQGKAQFQNNGQFNVVGTVCMGDYEVFITAFCKEYGYGDIIFLVEDGVGTATAKGSYRGTPVNNAVVHFTVQEYGVVGVKGSLIPQTHASLGAEAQISAVTALTRFLSARRSTGAVVSSVVNVIACYEFQNTSTQKMEIVPMWRIDTDNGSYYVDGNTATVVYE